MKKIQIALLCFGALFFSSSLSLAQSCQGSNGTVSGMYSYVANSVPMAGVPITPPGTTTGYSNTTIGKLIYGLQGIGSFAQSGTWMFDGSGNIFGTSSPTGTGSQQIGTYSVSPDCSIVATLTDTYYTTPGIGGAAPVPMTLKGLVGIVVGGGSEIQLGAPPATGAAPSQYSSRFNIQAIRTYSAICNVSNLTGPYALIATGSFTATPSGSTNLLAQPYFGIARVRFDGNGNVITDQAPSGSPLNDFQYSGTYTINPDCSGSITLFGLGSTSGASSTLNIVLTQPLVVLNPSYANVSLRAGIQFSIANSTQVTTGHGYAQ